MESKYFLIFFLGIDEGKDVNGNCVVECEEAFPNANDTLKRLRKQLKITNVVITNIIRLSEEEYSAWC